jgi:hypothetical protein
MKKLLTLVALPAIVSLSNAAHFSCAQEAPHEEKSILSEAAQQELCAMYFDNFE